jgi:protein-tyrosine-phosphatase/predicted ATP-grasp superfamily ATP-dependent carboligase
VTTGQKVLVIGDDTRSFLGIVRSLGRKGIELHVAPFNFRSPALRSRYISQICELPFYMGDGTEWLDAIRTLIDRERYQLIIPCDERALLPLDRHRDLLEALCKLAIPDRASITTLFDKHNTRQLAASLGVRIPRGRLLRPDDTAEAVGRELGLPLAVKPRQSFSVDRLYARGSVKLVDDTAALASALETIEPERFLIEAFFPGHGRGVSVLAHDGKILQAFEHHRVHEFAAGSYYRKSAPFTPSLLDATGKIIAALRYTGVAMFEFRFDEATADWALLEVNARPWGSLPLALAAGVDFPYRWFKLLVDGQETPPVKYRENLFGRHFTGDIYYLVWAAAQKRRQPWQFIQFVARSAAEFTRILIGREVSDTFVWADPKPAFDEVAQLLAERMAHFADRMSFCVARRRRRSRALVAQVLGRPRGAAPEIVFVCHGNICRSPFAAALLRKTLAGSPVTLEISSAGMLPVEGRPSTDVAIETAREMGVDLTPHVSQFFSKAQLQRAALIIVFEPANIEQIRKRYNDIAAPIIRLGDLAEDKAAADIADPYGYDAATYRRAYRQIEAGLRGLMSLLPPRR